MPSSLFSSLDAIPNKINLRKIRATLNLVCPKCQAEIEPSQIMRVNFEEIKCPFCDSIVKPQKKQAPAESS
jgi:hypothetical protein